MGTSISALDGLADDVMTLYEETEYELLRSVAMSLEDDGDPASYRVRKLAQKPSSLLYILSIIRKSRRKRVKIAEQCVASAFDYGSKGFVEDATKYGYTASAISIHNRVSDALRIVNELNRTLDNAEAIILRTLDDEYRRIVNNAASLVSSRSMSLREAIRRELEQFADRGITSFIDKSGRSWDIATYAEMATITAVERSVLEGFVRSMSDNGEDLAIVSSHIGACPLCVAWEDVVVSISGQSPYYPSLDEAMNAGLFHPRCYHHLRVFHDDGRHSGRNSPREVQPPSAEYSARQRQRYFERSIRKWKRRMAVATNPYDERVAYARVRVYQQRIRELLKANKGSGLSRKYWREGGSVSLSPDARRLKPVRIR